MCVYGGKNESTFAKCKQCQKNLKKINLKKWKDNETNLMLPLHWKAIRETSASPLELPRPAVGARHSHLPSARDQSAARSSPERSNANERISCIIEIQLIFIAQNPRRGSRKIFDSNSSFRRSIVRSFHRYQGFVTGSGELITNEKNTSFATNCKNIDNQGPWRARRYQRTLH